MPVSGRRLAVLALVVTMTVWGSSFVVTKLVLDEAGHFAVTALPTAFSASASPCSAPGRNETCLSDRFQIAWKE